MHKFNSCIYNTKINLFLEYVRRSGKSKKIYCFYTKSFLKPMQPIHFFFYVWNKYIFILTMLPISVNHTKK